MVEVVAAVATTVEEKVGVTAEELIEVRAAEAEDGNTVA